MGASIIRIADGVELRTYEGYERSFRPHAHTHLVIGLMLEGMRRIEGNGPSQKICEGQTFAVAPGAMHCCDAASGRFTLISLCIGKDAVRSLAGVKAEAAFADMPGIAVFDSADVVEDFAEMKTFLAGRSDTILLELAGSILSHAADGLPAASGSDKTCGCALERESFEASVRSVTGLGAVAADLGISVSQLVRTCRARYGATPHQMLLSLKCEHAADMLEAGAAPADVAERLGFADQAHFTRTFRDRIGFTPSRYRDLHQTQGR